MYRGVFKGRAKGERAPPRFLGAIARVQKEGKKKGKKEEKMEEKRRQEGKINK